MVAAKTRRYLSKNDDHFFVSVNLKSSCFWMCCSQAHTLPATLNGSAFVLTSFQVLIPLRFQACHSKLNASVGFCPYRLYHLPFVGSLPVTRTPIF